MHRRRKVDEKSCVRFLLCDPGWCVHKSDVQNKWDDNKMYNTHTVPEVIVILLNTVAFVRQIQTNTTMA